MHGACMLALYCRGVTTNYTPGSLTTEQHILPATFLKGRSAQERSVASHFATSEIFV